MGVASESNKRSTRRFECRVDVEYVVGDDRRTAVIRNLSLGGAYLETDDKVPYGTRVLLKFIVPTQKEAIEVGGHVRWTEPRGFGVQFDGLRARDVWALGKFFERTPG